ncbi:MAG: hypothetical protein LBH25_03240, partial [Fibromonadaceae bacterium]|nr:hypothetical protein [Fibromonadaceae bacterium]
MKKIAIILLILCVSAFAQQRIAILNTEDDGEPQLKISELSHLTDKLREIAGNVLKDRYGIMTQQSIVDKLGSRENAAKECKEASCLADLGRKLNAHYIAQGRTSRFGDNLTIKVELYNIASGLQVAIFTGDSKDVSGLVAVLYEKAPDMFKSMLGGKIPPTYPGGIGDVLIAGGGYEFAGEKSYLVNIATEPEGAVLSFNGMPNSRCTKTPCRVELAEGSVRMIANLEQ